jgi:hypothetical protein
MNKIPIIGTAVVNSSFWVARLLMSIDYPVEKFIIINNNGRGELEEELNAVAKIRHKFVDEVKVCHLPSNLGVAGSWNLIIKSNIKSPYWIIVNDDVSFGAGLLKEMHDTALEDTEAGVVHAHEGHFDVGSWDLFLIKDFIIEKFGLFDENTYPAYNEDADYIMRFLNDMPKRIMSLKGNYMHGMGNKGEYFEHGGQTRRTDPTLIEKINANNELTMEYMKEKWGEGWRMCNPFPKPFKVDSRPMSYWTYDLSFTKKKNLGF